MISSILFLIASVFYLIAGLGLIRLPDPLARLHAGTKASSLATALAMGAAFAHYGGWWLALLALATIGFVFLTAPLASHAVARCVLASRLASDQKPELSEPERPAELGDRGRL